MTDSVRLENNAITRKILIKDQIKFDLSSRFVIYLSFHVRFIRMS